MGIARNNKAAIAAKESAGWGTQTKRNSRKIKIDMDKTAYQICLGPMPQGCNSSSPSQTDSR